MSWEASPEKKIDPDWDFSMSEAQPASPHVEVIHTSEPSPERNQKIDPDRDAPTAQPALPRSKDIHMPDAPKPRENRTVSSYYDLRLWHTHIGSQYKVQKRLGRGRPGRRKTT